MDDDNYYTFIRGTWGGHESPAIVPNSENAATLAAMLAGTPLVEFSNSHRIILLDKVDHNLIECNVYITTLPAASCCTYQHGCELRMYYPEICDMILAFDKKYAGMDYVIYAYQGFIRQPPDVPMNLHIAHGFVIQKTMIDIFAIDTPICVLVGTKGGAYDLTPQQMTRRQLIGSEMNIALTIHDSDIINSYPSTTFIMSENIKDGPKQICRAVSSSTKRIAKAIANIPDGSRVCIVSAYERLITERVIAEHLRFFPQLITHEQVAIYENVIVDEDAVRYDAYTDDE